MADELIGDVPSPPLLVPRKTLYVTPVVVLALQSSKTECVPVPDKPIVVGEFVALLVMLTLAPFTVPAVAGANVTVRVADCPGVSTVPLGMPLALSPAPVTVTPEIVMFELPLFVTDVVSELSVPSPTLPKGKLVGLAPSDAAWVACVAAAIILNDITTADQVPDRFCVKSIGVAPVTLVRYSLAVPPTPKPVEVCMPLPPHTQDAPHWVMFQRGLPTA